MDFSVIIENKDLLLRGAVTTIWLTLSTIVIAVFCGTFFALARNAANPWLRVPAIAYSTTFRALPGLTVLFFTYYSLPSFGIYLTATLSAVVGLSLTSTAYTMEIIRAGLRSVPIGQFEAARALGIPLLKALCRIILPSAMRVISPPICSQFILIIKASSVASLVTVSELTGEAMGLITDTFKPVEFLLVVACGYLLISSVIYIFQIYLERRFALKNASNGEESKK